MLSLWRAVPPPDRALDLTRNDVFYRAFDPLPFDDEAARRYGVVRTQLRWEGRLIGGNDLTIASIAVAGSHAPITRNAGEVSKVSDLSLEVW